MKQRGKGREGGKKDGKIRGRARMAGEGEREREQRGRRRRRNVAIRGELVECHVDFVTGGVE